MRNVTLRKIRLAAVCTGYLCLASCAGGGFEITGEVYLQMPGGQVAPAAGSIVHVLPADSLGGVPVADLGTALWSWKVELAGMPASDLDSLTKEFGGAFDERVRDHADDISGRLRAGAYARVLMDDRKRTLAIYAKYLGGDKSAIFDPFLNPSTKDREFFGRWHNEDSSTPEQRTFRYMLNRMRFLICLSECGTVGCWPDTCDRYRALHELRRSFLASLDEAPSAVVAMDGTFSLRLEDPGEYYVFAARELRPLRGHWLVPLTLTRGKQTPPLVLNNSTFVEARE